MGIISNIHAGRLQMTTRFFYSKNPFVDNLARLHQIVSPKMLQIMLGDYRTSLYHAGGLQDVFVDVGSLVVAVGAVPITPCATNGMVTARTWKILDT